jgi:hypothetical protein
MTVLSPHHPARKKACHCSPNPHRPCTHTAVSEAKKKAATAKARATSAKIKAEAEKILKAHPPTKAQIAQAVKIQNDQAKERASARAAKLAAHPLSSKQRAAAHKKAVAAAHKAAITRAHKPKTIGPKTKAATPLPTSFLMKAEKTVRAQMAAAAKKKQLAKDKREHRNPHVKARKQAKQTKC